MHPTAIRAVHAQALSEFAKSCLIAPGLHHKITLSISPCADHHPKHQEASTRQAQGEHLRMATAPAQHRSVVHVVMMLSAGWLACSQYMLLLSCREGDTRCMRAVMNKCILSPRACAAVHASLQNKNECSFCPSALVHSAASSSPLCTLV